MAVAALVLFGTSFALTFGVRIALQVRMTGSTGLHGLSADASWAELLAAALLVLGLTLGVAAPVLALAGAVEPIAALDTTAVNVLGLLLAVSGLVLTFAAQLAMGDSWRIGVDPEERTRLVTDGPFALVRNPIYCAMAPTVLGLALMVPSVAAVAALACLVAGVELQVRLVEEPHLLRAHGEEYAAYAARVGRFLPGVGLLSDAARGV